MKFCTFGDESSMFYFSLENVFSLQYIRISVDASLGDVTIGKPISPAKIPGYQKK
jgi:hypothetical protein